MSVGVWQLVIIVVLIVVLFGRGKISDLMGDVAKGITSFRKGLKDSEADDAKSASVDIKARKPAKVRAEDEQAKG